MTPEIGQFALILGCLLAILQCVAFPLLARNGFAARQLPTARISAMLQFLCLTIAFGALVFSYIDSDFTVVNIAANSHRTKPFLYKISATWGNHEGSMLLWVWILGLYAWLLSFANFKDQMLQSLALTVQSFIGAGFLLFILFTSNPFLRVYPPPLNGKDLNPILQDPGLAIHPPMLYLGYVGFSIVYSLSIAALILNRVDRDWAKIARPWVLFTWSCLSLGIGLGSWWAYRELGWGGWWFWDPVENASLLPWLAGTALLHSLAVLEKRQGLKRWVILLGILTFSLSLLGTFLVRSGIITSVHSFASDPTRGLFILAYLAIVCGGGFALYAWRAPQLEGGEKFPVFSRGGAILINNILLLAICGTVALGTLYPVGLELFAHQSISIGAGFYNATLLPMVIPILILAGISPYFIWDHSKLDFWRCGAGSAFTIALSVTLLTLFLDRPRQSLALLGIAFGTWAMIATLLHLYRQIAGQQVSGLQRFTALPIRNYSMAISHIGVGLLALGIGLSSGWKQEAQMHLALGETQHLGDFTATYLKNSARSGDNYNAVSTEFVVRFNNIRAELKPETRHYPVRDSDTAEVDYRSTLAYDLYGVTSQLAKDGSLTLRLYYLPGMAMIWCGILMIAMGGVVTLPTTLRRKKI